MLAATALASPDAYLGTWQNVDAGTGGVTAVEVTQSGAAYSVHLWGKCHPTDCDWGTVPATAHFGAVTGAGPVLAVSATYDQGFVTRWVVVKSLPGDRLEAQILSRYKSGDNRKPTLETATFKRRAVRPVVAVRPEVIREVVGATPAEDCIAFDPGKAKVEQIRGTWKITVGSMWMLDFGAKEAEARTALAIIQRLKLDKQCFVGRPDPSFEYFLAGGKGPTGNVPGEDCVGFSTTGAKVEQIQGSWKIVDGSHWMFDFGANQAEARQALALIKKYGFSKSCFVGRPDPKFKYLKQ